VVTGLGDLPSDAEVKKKKRRKKQRVKSLNSPGFGPVEVEENVPSSKKVREMLEEITEDDALNKVLEKHNWQVGKVIELPPSNPQKCEGYNENKGQLIALRVRNRSGRFKSLHTLYKVMFHELAHNEHSNHGKAFKELMKQIEVEYYEFQSRDHEFQGSGARVGGRHKISHNPRENAASAALKRFQGMNFPGRGHRLSRNSNRPIPGVDPRDMARIAAIKRWSGEDQEIMDGCMMDESLASAKADDIQNQAIAESDSFSCACCGVDFLSCQASEKIKKKKSSEKTSLEYLYKILENILNHPTKDKFRNLNLASISKKMTASHMRRLINLGFYNAGGRLILQAVDKNALQKHFSQTLEDIAQL